MVNLTSFLYSNIDWFGYIAEIKLLKGSGFISFSMRLLEFTEFSRLLPIVSDKVVFYSYWNLNPDLLFEKMCNSVLTIPQSNTLY